MSLAARSASDEGASLIMVTASLLVIFGFAAIVVDSGLGWSERRQAQSGADFGALAAVQFSTPSDSAPECPISMDALTLATCRGAVEAISVVEGNLPQGGLDPTAWLNCTDPIAEQLDLVAEIDFGAGAQEVECISFSSTTQDARVRVPTLDVATTFARVIGFDLLNVDAVAEAHGSLPAAYRVLPFGIPSNSGRYDCLKAAPGGIVNWGACAEGPTNGNFHYLDLPTYGNTDVGTTSSNCNPSGATLVNNMIVGIDHGLGSHPDGTASQANPALRDDAGNDTTDRLFVCPIFGSNANEVDVQNGNVTSSLTPGLTYGNSLGRGPLWGSLPFVQNAGMGQPAISLNDTPLWDFLINTAICPGAVTLPVDTTQEMVDCINGWNPSDGVVFSDTITSSSRYAFAPRLHDPFSSAGWYLIKELQPVYLNTTYWGCSGSNCAGIHSPGTTTSGPCVIPSTSTGSEPADDTCGQPIPISHTNMVAVTSFNLERAMLPHAALDPVPSDGPLLNIALTR